MNVSAQERQLGVVRWLCIARVESVSLCLVVVVPSSMDTRLERPIPFSREARLHAEIPNTPVDVRIKDIQACYNKRNEKLVLGQRHTTKKSNKGDKGRRGRSKRRGKSPGSGKMTAGDRKSGETNIMGGPAINLEDSVSMLSIGTVIDEFKSLMTQELSMQDSVANDGSTASTRPQSQGLFPEGSKSTLGIAPLRKSTRSKYQFEEVKLYCRFPKCNKEFKHAFDLYVHSRNEHAHLASRPFKEPVIQSTRPNTTGSIDPFHKRPPVKANCSGILPAVPKSRPPSPDATGVVWGVEVLQQQRKWNDLIDAERFREHTKDLKKVNAQLTLDLKASRFANNKSNAAMTREALMHD